MCQIICGVCQTKQGDESFLNLWLDEYDAEIYNSNCLSVCQKCYDIKSKVYSKIEEKLKEELKELKEELETRKRMENFLRKKGVISRGECFNAKTRQWEF
tara:strand:+ start:63 stop:362 length:300 start_codon:yes stop_codon:yes gene_type:complete